MTTTHRLRSWLLGLALGVLLTLLAAPSTRWLVRAQIAATGLGGTPAAQVRGADEARRRALAAHPDDLPLQMAALQNGGGDRQAAYLRTLVRRFRDSPALYAALLKCEIGSSMDRHGVYLSRAPEEEYLSGHPQPQTRRAAPPPDPAALAAFDADAAAGERLDPDNAFFPLMRAVGLFAARRDDAALAAVGRAGRKTAWREYVQDEINGRLRLSNAAYGDGSALSHISVVAATLFPQYAQLRAVARVAIAEAAQAEQAGQSERGMAVRRAVRRSGGLMRADSSSYIGSLVGIAIAAIATSRPGGDPPLEAPPGGRVTSGEERMARRLQAFDAYARRVGHPEEAQQARAEAAAGQAARSVFSKAEDRSVFGNTRLARLGVWWVADLLALANAFWLLVLSAVAAALARLPAVREQRPLSRPALWGAVVLLLAAACPAFCYFGAGDSQDTTVFLVALVAAPVIGLLALRLLRASPPDRAVWRQDAARFSRAFLWTGLALLALGALAAWQAQGVVGFAATVRQITGLSGSDDGTVPGVPQAQETEVAAVLGSLLLPLLLALVLSLAGRARRVPVSVALVRGFRTAGLPLACLLALIYGAAALGTLRQERVMENGLARMVRHEGRYYAALAGQDWPAPPE